MHLDSANYYKPVRIPWTSNDGRVCDIFIVAIPEVRDYSQADFSEAAQCYLNSLEDVSILYNQLNAVEKGAEGGFFVDSSRCLQKICTDISPIIAGYTDYDISNPPSVESLQSIAQKRNLLSPQQAVACYTEVLGYYIDYCKTTIKAPRLRSLQVLGSEAQAISELEYTISLPNEVDWEKASSSLHVTADGYYQLSTSGKWQKDTAILLRLSAKDPATNTIYNSSENGIVQRKYILQLSVGDPSFSISSFQIGDRFADITGNLLSSLVLLAFMFYLNWQLGLIAAIVTILAWLVSKGMNKVSLREAAGRQEQSERLTDAVLSFVEGIGVIKSYNLLGEKSEELSGNFKRSRNTSLDFERKMTPWTMGLNILYGIGIAAIFGLSIVLEQSGALSLAYVLGVLLFVFDLFGPLKALYGEASRLTVMNAALDRIEAVLDEPELSDNGKQHIPAQAQPGQPEVLFNDVTFAYQDKEVLHHISFAMKKNSMTALVGPSGSGKSTIANLLARLWDVKSGNVTIRGVDIRNVPLSELMDQISMVFQRVYLFQDTIYNNIIMGKPDATEEEVYEAARKARCYDFIMALPDGFQTVVGEGGATLSGGEKQRISIARCILKDAPIVILDEATASVDTDNESYIQEAISELVKGKTLLVIAHRLNTIQNADQILVIDNGQIAQQGTHEELLKQSGIYQDFVNIRKSAAGWSLA